MRNTEIVKEHIWTNKLFTDLTWDEAKRVKFKGLPPIALRVRLEIFKEYKEEEKLDMLRLAQDMLFNRRQSTNLVTNLKL